MAILMKGQRSPRGFLDRLLDEFRSPASTSSAPREGFAPAVDVIEAEQEYVMSVELPGMSESDVQLELDDANVLTVRGEKNSEKRLAPPHRAGAKASACECSERKFGKFSRSVQLPPELDPSHVQAEFSNGVLQVHVPKAEATRGRPIPIRIAGTKTEIKAESRPETRPETKPVYREEGNGRTVQPPTAPVEQVAPEPPPRR